MKHLGLAILVGQLVGLILTIVLTPGEFNLVNIVFAMAFSALGLGLILF